MKTGSLSIHRSGHGPPIVLLHGWGMNAAVFDTLAAELEKSREVINVDLPGYGSSPWDASLSFSDQAEWIASELPEGEILGWSLGGLYALEMHRLRPKQFARLLLVCTSPCFVRRSGWNCAVTADVFDEFAASLNRGWQATVKRFLTLQMYGNDDARILIRELMMRLEKAGEPNIEALKFGLYLLKHGDFRSLLADLDRPIKMVFGQRDMLVPNAVVKEIGHINRNIAVESLATAAHAPFLSHTAEFLTML